MQPSKGNYYEAGLTKVFFNNLRLDANYFRRTVNNFADDNQLENTTISFPIAFHNAIVYGADGKLQIPEWKHFSGFVSYSYEVGNAWNPVTGGLFLGANAAHSDDGTLSGIAGSAQHGQRAAALPSDAQVLVSRRSRL